LLRALERLSVVGSVLYVAAHPDDENTRLLAWLVGERGLQATYLSMTRGGGGQNLIGAEQAEMLGVVRTGELLAARSIDGAQQRFSRARDFGYSKSPDETLAIWGRDAALSDLVWTIRSLRPDVVITRFDSAGRGHGHHTASAILAAEAFEAAGDPSRYTDQLEWVEPWTPDRLLYNKSHWRIDDDTDTSQWNRIDVGGYDAARGVSFGELAAWSRSTHKSQGFGSAPRVGPQMEYFVPIAGTPLTPDQDPFDGLEASWARFPGTKTLQKTLRQAAQRFDPRAPHEVLPLLAQAHRLLQAVPDEHWRRLKTAELERVMVACAGLWMTARSEQAAVAPGETLKVVASFLNRSGAAVELGGVGVSHAERQQGVGPTAAQVVVDTEFDVAIPADAALTIPHWLVETPTPASYAIPDPQLRDRADTPASLQARWELVIGGVPIHWTAPVEHAWTDAVQGERRHPVEVLPPVTATFDEDVIMLPAGRGAKARLSLRATTPGGASGTLKLSAPEGYAITPNSVDFELTTSPVHSIDLLIEGEATEAAQLIATVTVDGRDWAYQQAVIDHEHLPRRTVLRPAAVRLQPLGLEMGPVRRIAYVPGPGDRVAKALRQVGYTVDEVDEDAIASGALSGYDAVIVGIRAYNTRPRLLALHEVLMEYVAVGGRLLVQYNTNNRFNPLDGPIGPRPFQISRDRVTDEGATMTPTDPAHLALVEPNRLVDADFDGWVQERGLYFADEWDEGYQTLFSAHDPGGEPLEGSTLLIRHGQGIFVYTGLSFFRQLPAGVPGAYRLLANLLAW
jgi:LmbE family N-acetylglucosaminyl deacetylase